MTETKENTDVLEQRKTQVIAFLKKHDTLVYMALLAIIILVTFNMRIQPIKNLRDVTNNQYIPAEPDSFMILYYAEYILENGHLPEKDTLRYYPDGFDNIKEFFFLPYFLVYLYKFMNFFSSDVTIQLVDLLYPPLTFAVSLIFFFLFVSRLFNKRVALIATAYLSVSSLYLYRTTAGFSDKESLALMFIYMSLYFFTSSWKTESSKKAIVYAGIAGVATACAGLVWGGVQFLFFSYGLFALLQFLLNKFKEKDAWAYITWFIATYIVLYLGFPAKFNLGFAVSNTAVVDSTLAFAVAIVYLIAKKLNKPFIHELEQKHRLGMVCVVASVLLGLLLVIVLYGPGFLFSKIAETQESLTQAFSATRWARTVAESRQPYLRDLIGEVGGFYFLLFVFGIFLMVYRSFSVVKEHRYKFSIVFALLWLSVLYTRYSSGSILNGQSGLANFLYFGMLVFVPIFFIAVYIYSRYKKIDIYSELHKIDASLIFMLGFALITAIGARSAIRLFLMIAPTIAIMIGYSIDGAYNGISRLGRKWVTYTFIVAAFVLLVIPTTILGIFPNDGGNLRPYFSHSMLENYNNGYSASKYSGSSYNQQWQAAMQWARENTPKDAVFAHWWDYGYYVIYGARRATLSDGGNTGGNSLNYFIGRHVLTGQNATEALEYLKTKGATYLLVVSDEIGKYPAYSTIGSDLTYDRYSYINAFILDTSKTQETRNTTAYAYVGSYPFDEPLEYNGEVYPAGSSGIGAFLVPMQITKDSATILQPEAIVVYNNKQANIPLECVVANDKIIRFEKKGLPGCLRIVPRLFSDGKMNPVGAAIYASRRVSSTLFGNLYLFGQKWEGFDLAYTDESQLPLAVYPAGNLFGPLKIWAINASKDIQTKEMYKSKDLPDQRLAY